MDLEVIKTTPILEPMAQLNIGSNFTVNKTTPDGKKARGHVSAFDPFTGKTTWEVEYAEPPLASLLSTKGNLVFVPDARGWIHALDAKTGKELWSRAGALLESRRRHAAQRRRAGRSDQRRPRSTDFRRHRRAHLRSLRRHLSQALNNAVRHPSGSAI